MFVKELFLRQVFKYSRRRNSVPVDWKKFFKMLKVFFFGQKIHMYTRTYISHTYLVVGNVSISFNLLLDLGRQGLDQFLQVWSVVNPEDPQLSNLVLQLLQLVGWVSQSCTFILDHTFSIGLRSGLLPGHLINWMCGSGTSAKETHSFICQPNEKFSS